MALKQIKYLTIITIVLVLMNTMLPAKNAKITLKDDFEKGLTNWDLVNPDKIKIKDSGDATHGKILALHPGGSETYALIKDSHQWTNIKVEGEFFFPHFANHYMGLIYNYKLNGVSPSFGCIYLYGPLGDEPQPFFETFVRNRNVPPSKFVGNIIHAAPHRDGFSAHYLYPEYWVTLKGHQAVKPGEWHPFKAEIIGQTCHYYVDDMETPKITFEHFENNAGRVGFKPRDLGSECWVDNISVTTIETFSYTGAPKPEGRNYKPEKLLTRWDAIGPFTGRQEKIEKDGYIPAKTYTYRNEKLKWKPFKTDGRGCVVTGRMLRKFDTSVFAYFHTVIQSQQKREAVLEFCCTHRLLLWVNNKPAGRVKVEQMAEYGFTETDRDGIKMKITLKPGTNHIMVMAGGGRSGGDGFYAHLEEE
ncbi:MAG: hypothetical protein GY757_25325 [bacterium]|nr:hypothetical protein [bacterium]